MFLFVCCWLFIDQFRFSSQPSKMHAQHNAITSFPLLICLSVAHHGFSINILLFSDLLSPHASGDPSLYHSHAWPIICPMNIECEGGLLREKGPFRAGFGINKDGLVVLVRMFRYKFWDGVYNYIWYFKRYECMLSCLLRLCLYFLQ